MSSTPRQRYDRMVHAAQAERRAALEAAETVYQYQMTRALVCHRIALGVTGYRPGEDEFMRVLSTPTGPCDRRAPMCTGIGTVESDPEYLSLTGEVLYRNLCPSCLTTLTESYPDEDD